ncbi:two-component system nitrogen regulation sensor histidine kinase NtrY [Maritalea mobilis]|uniref:histidine kinase n=1 Tax=Maritalea mobilis TaxID=483324 RepID=A0A4R6VQS4_9HYPH|nr:PAS domain-containing sensor histidine kinase [Maritalea mobilis]TDQ66322.1 two-component system nitrogen regulation sensor histidine kinase NtrY [Maritalea mobilis]
MNETTHPKIKQLSLRQNSALRIFGVVLVLASVVSAVASFMILTGATSIEPEPNVWAIIWLVNAVLVVLVIALLITEGFLLIRARVSKQAGSGLHVRLVGMFALAAAVPAFIVAMIATFALNQGLDHWFSERSRAMVESSQQVAQSYLQEHANVLRNDIIGISGELERVSDVFDENRENYRRILTTLAQIRSLPYVYILDGNQEIVERAQISVVTTPPQLPENLLVGVDEQTIELIRPGQKFSFVGGVIKLDNYPNHYLFVARGVDPEVLEYMRLSEQNVNEYREYESNRVVFQITFAIMYIGLAIVVLLAAVWVGIYLANRLVAPIRNLMIASNRISTGDLNVRVPTKGTTGDMRDLSARFNRMTSQLSEQHGALISANETIDQRRQFTEAVLEGVSAGIIGLDPEGHVSIVNGRASSIFESDEKELIGASLRDIALELGEIFDQAQSNKTGQIQEQIVLKNRQGEERTYQVRITREGTIDSSKGYVITLDDISDLIAAQRTSVWADVARRIAHEIKNPLTPIQLSAERLRRRYKDKLADDYEVFDKCTNTIVRQVGDIGRMVDEFSTFARMPSASFAQADLGETVRQAVFSEGVRHPEIALHTKIPDGDLLAQFDDRLMSQVLTNLIKNAAESIEGEIGDIQDPTIYVGVKDLGDEYQVTVSDNGKGWPKENRMRLLEPYNTTREKGTGLGLAIVSKIVEQHNGRVELFDAAPDEHGRVGAVFAFTLPKMQKGDQSNALATNSPEKTNKPLVIGQTEPTDQKLKGTA